MRKIVFGLTMFVVFAVPIEAGFPVSAFGSITRIAGLLLIIGWSMTVIVTNKVRRPHLFHLAVLCYILWNSATIFWSFDVSRTANRVETYAQLLILTLILWDSFLTLRAVKIGLQFYILGAYLSASDTIMNFLADNGTSGRYAATGFNLNDLGLILAIGLPIAWYLTLNPIKGRYAFILRVINFLYLPTAFFSIVLTASRGSIIATIPAFLYILWSLPRFRLVHQLLILVPLSLSLVSLYYYVPTSSVERLSTASDSISEGDLNGRVDIWKQGLEAFLDRPLLGVGSGAFRDAIDLGKAPHNTFVSVLVDQGIFGFSLFVAVLFIVASQIFRQPRWEAELWTAVFMVWTLGILVHNWEQKKPTWLFLSLIVISANLLTEQAETRTQLASVKVKQMLSEVS